jgi:hypothetical protein
VGDELTLLDEAGTPRRFRVHDVVDLDERTYYLVEAIDDPDQVLVLCELEGNLEAVHGEELNKVLAVLESDT